jgi:hypothetical protein
MSYLPCHDLWQEKIIQEKINLKNSCNTFPFVQMGYLLIMVNDRKNNSRKTLIWEKFVVLVHRLKWVAFLVVTRGRKKIQKYFLKNSCNIFPYIQMGYLPCQGYCKKQQFKQNLNLKNTCTFSYIQMDYLHCCGKW